VSKGTVNFWEIIADSSGEIQILDSTGNVERVIPFDDGNRNL
jgi:hypothetical protein